MAVLGFATLTTMVVVCCAKDIVPGLQLPQGLQGHDDENWPTTLIAQGRQSDLKGRYKSLSKMKPGIRRYNMFWSAFETTRSSVTPQNCPAGSVMIPSNETERASLGYHFFHCHREQQLTTMDVILNLDKRIGAQNAAILYSAPAFYRDPNCTGFIFGKDVIKGGCVPMDQFMDDYEDFVTMLVLRYPTLVHFIVWNEVASAGWMDCSPHIPNRAGTNGSNPLSSEQFQYWVAKYAALVKKTAVALERQARIAMIWTSNDRLWERPHQKEKQPLHTGVKPFLDRLWPLLANESFIWSLAVHPYDPGNPADSSEFAPGHHPQAYTFATLPEVVKYQRNQVVRYKGLNPDTDGHSYTLLYASEQGWPYPACCADRIRGRNICSAHSLSLSLPEVVAVTHNYFQDSPGGSEQGGQDYGLIAGNISAALDNGTHYPTYAAYLSTSPDVWGSNDQHYCCDQWRLGCATHVSHGDLDPLSVKGNQVQVHGWAWDESATRNGFDLVHVAISLDGKDVATLLANISRPDIVEAGACPSPDHGYIATIDLSMLAEGNHKLQAFILNPPSHPELPRWELGESPRCICDAKPCTCQAIFV